MNELLQKIAEERGYPADLVMRAAAARAKVKGISTEAVVAGWAGVEAGEVPAAATPAPSAAAPAAAAAAPPATSGPQVEVLAPDEPQPTDEGESVDAQPELEPDEGLPAGLLSGFPAWLAAAFIVIPTIAVLYVLALPNGPACGSAGQLAIDPESGIATSCDGTEYGVEAANFFATGEAVYNARCVACHGPIGGGGAGPALNGGAVLVTFGSCSDHIEWIALATGGWPTATYGDTNKPVGSGGVMPAFGDILTEEELAAVTLYERVQFGRAVLGDAEADCGLGEGTMAAGG